MDLELRLLRTFATVARERSFRRAAERLHTTQPTLTRQVQALEARVGARLMHRHPRDLELTAAGRVLLRSAERLLMDAERALDQTRRAAAGEDGHLSVGFLASASETLGPLVRTTRERHPGIAFTLIERAWAEQTAGLESGEDDLAVVRDLRTDAWTTLELAREPLCIVLPADHPLARRKRLVVDDLQSLADVPFLASRRWMEGREARWGFVPAVADDIVSVAASFALVREGLGVSLMPVRRGRPRRLDGLVFVPLQGEFSRLQIAWNPATDRPPRRHLLAAVGSSGDDQRPA